MVEYYKNYTEFTKAEGKIVAIVYLKPELCTDFYKVPEEVFSILQRADEKEFEKVYQRLRELPCYAVSGVTEGIRADLIIRDRILPLEKLADYRFSTAENLPPVQREVLQIALDNAFETEEGLFVNALDTLVRKARKKSWSPYWSIRPLEEKGFLVPVKRFKTPKKHGGLTKRHRIILKPYH